MQISVQSVRRADTQKGSVKLDLSIAREEVQDFVSVKNFADIVNTGFPRF